MITENELKISNQSYTKKDFYQVYTEILEIAKNLSSRWNPQYSNESDPGVVLLKLLAFVADKNNYNIDKTILEVFMPSATQQESMRKLTDMLGYNMKYIQSATTEIAFSWNSDEGDLATDLDNIQKNQIILPKFTTNVQDSEATINYVLLEDVVLNHRYETKKARAIEGSYVEFQINSDNIVLASNLTDSNRLYLPESTIAENGIFVTSNGEVDPDWIKVDNLNVQISGQKVWKFGFDSLRQKPYIQFPDDINSIIGNGLKVAYIRSSGINGNVSARQLNTLENSELAVLTFAGEPATDENGSEITVNAADGNMSISNLSSVINGANMETIDEAYKNFKKTVGTFDTLINCRDYANAIYQMVKDETFDNSPLVSNIQVGDVANDLNLTTRIAMFDGYGVSEQIIDDTMEEVTIYETRESTTSSGTKWVKGLGKFDIHLYPLNPIKAYTEKEFNKSFTPNTSNIYEIKNQLHAAKTINHRIKQPLNSSEAYLIKNYYSLNGKIITNKKLTNYEVIQVQQAVYNSLYKNFNARELNYGEAIPYDKLVEVMMNADSRIKAIVLDEPEQETFIMFAKADGGVQEHKLSYINAGTTQANDKGKEAYLKFVAQNILAGRAPLFDYDKEFKVRYNQLVPTNNVVYGHTFTENNPETKYNYVTSTTGSGAETNNITYIATNLSIPTTYNSQTKEAQINHTLAKNEVLQLVSNTLATDLIYPSYVNYYLHLANANGRDAIPAWMQSLDNCGEIGTAQSGTENYKLYYVDYWLNKYDSATNWSEKSAEEKLTAYYNFVNNATSVKMLESTNTYTRKAKFYKENKHNLANYPGLMVSVDNHVYNQWSNYQGTGRARAFTSVAELPARGCQWLLWTDNFQLDGTNYKHEYKLETVVDQWEYDETSASKSKQLQLIANRLGNMDTFSSKKGELETILANHVGSELATKLNSNIGFYRENESAYSGYSGYSGVWTTGWHDQTGATATSGTKYKIDYIVYSEGVSASSDGISANTIYELREGDELYINYTQDEIVHNFEYTRTSIKDNGQFIANGSEELKKLTGLESVVIKVNFDIKDSLRHSSNHTFAKTSGYLSSWNSEINGMFSLGASDEIRMMKSNSVNIKSISKWYWTSDDNQVIFTKRSDNGVEAVYGVILEDGQYVYYTDESENNLLTLGSGTELLFTTKTKSNGSFPSQKTWILNASVNSKISSEDILEKGLAAFGSVDWQYAPFGMNFDENNYLTINILDIKTFIEGDKINSVILSNSTGTSITLDSNSWTEVSQLTVNSINQCDNISKAAQGESKISFLNHRIRPILNINMGPDLIQELTYNSDGSKQELSIYSSYFIDENKSGTNKVLTNSEIVNYFDNPDAVFKEIKCNNVTKTYSPSTALTKTYNMYDLVTHNYEGTTGYIGNQNEIRVDATTGKLSVKNENNWCQFNNSTTLSFNINEHATITVECYEKNFKINSVEATAATFTTTLTNTSEVTIQSTSNSNWIKRITVNGPNSIQLKATANIQRNGNPSGVAVHKYSIALERTDDLKVYEIKSSMPMFKASSTSDYQTLAINNFNEYTRIDFANTYEARLPLYIPKSRRGLIALYYVPDDDAKKTYGPKIYFENCLLKRMSDNTQISNGFVIPPNKMIILFVAGTSTDLGENAFLKFMNNSSNTDGMLMVKDLDIVNVSNNDYGFNLQYLGLPNNTSEIANAQAFILYQKLRALDVDGNFYWNVPIDNAAVIDEDCLDSTSAWTNKNNLFARYTLCQLDTNSFSNITVARSSRLNN